MGSKKCSKETVFNKKQDEKILVVKRTTLFHGATVRGFKPLTDFSSYQKIIKLHKEFLWRSNMEQDESYKQIIPYLVFTAGNKFFLMQRKSSASEQRLKNKYSLGIGGHIREEDIDSNNIEDWASREFHEEVDYKGKLSIKPLGLINDDSSFVGRVHFGFVFLLSGSNENISIKSELKSGMLFSLKKCLDLRKDMEAWSQLVFDHLNMLDTPSLQKDIDEQSI